MSRDQCPRIQLRQGFVGQAEDEYVRMSDAGWLVRMPADRRLLRLENSRSLID
jgi:multidrug transporter EmrE-like cation transporter